MLDQVTITEVTVIEEPKTNGRVVDLHLEILIGEIKECHSCRSHTYWCKFQGRLAAEIGSLCLEHENRMRYLGY